MAIAIVVILLVVGSVIFHFASPWWFTPIASNWGMIDTTVDITFWVTGVVFVLVNLFLAYCVIKFRHKAGQKAHYEPENKKLETWLTVITAVGVAAMLAPGLVVWGQFVDVPDDAHEVEVVGQQWHWSFRYPGKDDEFGKVDPLLISVDNPFGMDPDDPTGQDDVLIAGSQMHLPVDKPVKVLLRSKDVLHNYTVPQFRVKMDMVPGTISHLWLTPTSPGKYEIMCEELCGMAHHTMRGRVVVDTQEDFDAWLQQQPTYADIAGAPSGDVEAGKVSFAACAACHGQQAEGNLALNAPKLAGLDAWYLKRQLQNYKPGIRGSDPNDMLGAQMRGMAAALVDDAAINNVVAYIGSLPDSPSPQTIDGDVSQGAQLFATCVNCHGKQGEGIWTMNAPRIAGMSDWYTARQLRDFRDGIRGGHPLDFYGRQMAQMSQMLDDEQEINDVVAYLNTLGGVRVATTDTGAPGSHK
ncbi:MAG: cytochrome c oxidase subunit II [Gammaproteobacteria bacterium]|jgi:cytochrome c oxidase subunit 2